ncbi:hypothetical protein ACFMJX_19130, partial [Acinetobacter baumannii]
MSIYIDSHKAVLKQVGDIFLDMYSPLPNHHLNQFNPSDGDGYSEISLYTTNFTEPLSYQGSAF